MVWLLDVLKNKKSSGNLGHQKYDGVLIWDTPVGTVIPEDQATSVLLKMMNADFYKVDVKPQFMLNFLNSVDVFQDKSIADEKLRTFFDKISYQAGSEFIKFDWHSGFIGWETKFGQDSAVSIQRKFILLKKAINLLSFIVSNKNIYIGEQKEIILSQGMSDFFLFADDILSEFSYEKAYFDKQFRVDLGKVCDFIGGFNVNENYTAYKNQIVHYFLLKTKNFLPDYSFNSEITLDKNSGFTKYVGVSYYLSADLFKYSNLVFFSVKDLENMYIFASNHFADSELIVTTKSKNQSMNHKDRMRIIDEGTSFVFEHEKIRGYLNFPDVFEEIMKKSFVQALNDVISHQMDYKTIVEDLAITGSFDSKNTFQVAVEALKGNKTDSIVRVDKLFELIDKFGASFNNGFKFSSLPGFKDAKELILSGQQIPSNNLWISKVNGLIESKYKNTFASNVLRALVYVDIKQENIIDATVRTFVWEMKKYSHDESLFKSFSFDARESRERVFKSVFNVGKNCVECFYDYFANDLIINKIYSQDDYLCSKMMELIIKDWEDEKDKDSSFAKAIKVKDFYALVVLNSSSEYENIFVEKYASVVDKIYHKYVYEVSREDTRIVMVNNFHLNKFWAYRENKGVSIRQMWAMLKRLKSSENDLKKVFDESKLKVKIDGDVGTSPAYNDTVSVILKFNKYDQKIANRLIPLWIKHCLVSDDLSFAKLKEMYDVGKMSTVSES